MSIISERKESAVWQHCLDCIELTEKEKRPAFSRPVIGECVPAWGDEYCGNYSITEDYWSKCGMHETISGSNETEMWERCADDEKCARDCVYGYMRKYEFECQEYYKRTELSCIDYGTIHSGGGVSGCLRRKTDNHIGYYAETMIRLCNLTDIQPENQNNVVIISVTVALVVALIIGFIGGGLLWRKKKRKVSNSKLEGDVMRRNYYGGDPKNRGDRNEVKLELADCSQQLKDVVFRFKIGINSVEMCEEIGRGHFGQIRRAKLFTNEEHTEYVTTAVKLLKNNKTSHDDMESFLEEAAVMADFDHPNVLHLIGIIWEADETPVVVLPYMGKGDLQSLVKKQEMKFTELDMMGFLQQILRGLAYLETQRFVHRDIALRNCLVSDYFIIKISDFGLSRDTYNKNYYVCSVTGKQLPWKWLAPECYTEGKFSSKSDVWAFGILMWELFTGAGTPYPAIANVTVLQECLEAGYRLSRPQKMPETLNKMMRECWHAEPDNRPTFALLTSQLDLLMEEQDISANYSYTDEEDYRKRLRAYRQRIYTNIPVPAPRKRTAFSLLTNTQSADVVYDNELLYVDAVPEPNTPPLEHYIHSQNPLSNNGERGQSDQSQGD